MKTRYAVTVGLVAGIGIGAVAVQGLHAQSNPPIYYIGEIEITNADGYAKEYLPTAQGLIESMGGRYLASGKATPVEGAPPASRVILVAWDSMEALQAWRNSDKFKKGREIGNKYATFRAFAIQGKAQ